MGQHKQFKCPNCKKMVYPKKVGRKVDGDTVTTTYACRKCRHPFAATEQFATTRNKRMWAV